MSSRSSRVGGGGGTGEIQHETKNKNLTCHEDVARIRNRAAFAEELEEVPELAVDVAADRDGARDGLDVGLFDEDRADAVAEGLHVRLGEVLALGELLDPFVRVGYRHYRGRPPRFWCGREARS